MDVRLRKFSIIMNAFFLSSLNSGCTSIEFFGLGFGAICDMEIFILTKQEVTNDGACTP